MMSKSSSPLSRGWRALGLLPLVCLGLGLQARTVYVRLDKDSEKIITYEMHALSGSVWKGEGGTLSFFDNTFEIILNRHMISGDYSTEGGIVELTFEDYRNKATGKAKHGKDVLTGSIEGNTLTIRYEDGTLTFSKVASAVVLNIRTDGSIESDGKVYTTAQLKEIIPPHDAGEPLATVQIVATDNVRMGAINDVEDELRRLGSFKVQYVSASGRDDVAPTLPPSSHTPGVLSHDEAPVRMDRKDICVVRLNSLDKVFFEDGAYDQDADLLRIGKSFLKEHGRNTCFAFVWDRGTSYGAYQHMQELLAQIYAEVRDEKAHEVYGKALSELSEEELQDIYKMIPMGIVKAERSTKVRE